MTLRVAQFFLKITHLSFSMGPRGPRAYGLRPRLWVLKMSKIASPRPLPLSPLDFFPLFRSLYFSLALHYLNAWNRLITTQNTEQEVNYSTAFCFCFVLLKQKTCQTGIVQCNTLSYFARALARIRRNDVTVEQW